MPHTTHTLTVVIFIDTSLVQESVQVQDAIVWRGFCAIRRGFQFFT
ncbi:Uncharacterised protein [Salmonella enterica subsp. enterica]|uniref:Uncharacterized protein n=1 Tax=Salmonella enterica I TaxID=59201 RepID=A0A379WW64_SALET|nr:Uncharacterised protein [Salmonella enterica subsp. enterica]